MTDEETGFAQDAHSLADRLAVRKGAVVSAAVGPAQLYALDRGQETTTRESLTDLALIVLEGEAGVSYGDSGTVLSLLM